MQLLEYSDMQVMNLEQHEVVNAFITDICAGPSTQLYLSPCSHEICRSVPRLDNTIPTCT